VKRNFENAGIGVVSMCSKVLPYAAEVQLFDEVLTGAMIS
jgi:hypothetical protein